MAQSEGCEDSVDTAWGTPPQPLASCPGLPPALHGSVVPLQHRLCQDSPRPQRQLQQARLGSGTAAQPREPPRRAGTGGDKGHAGAKGQRAMGWAAPRWLASRLTCASPKVTDPLDTALLSRAGTQISTQSSTLLPSAVPLSLQRCSQIPPPMPLKTDGMQIIPPFQLLFKPCWPPLRAAAASHTAGGAGTAQILGARRGEQPPSERTKELLIPQRRAQGMLTAKI